MSLFGNNLFNNNNNSIFNFNNNKKKKSIGVQFKGLDIEEKNGKAIYYAITSSPEFLDLSLEELRYNDIINNTTGLSPSQHNINKKQNNIFFGQSNDNIDRKIFQGNNNIKDKDIFKTISKNEVFNFNEKRIEEENTYNNMDNKMIKKSSSIFNFNNINNNFNNKNYNFDLNKNNDNSNNNNSNNNNSNSLIVNMDKSKSNKVNIEINDNKINILINNKINIDINDNSLSINTQNININRKYDSLLINTNNIFNNDIQKYNLLNSSRSNKQINKNGNNLINIFDNNNYNNNNNKKVSNIFDLINNNETIQKEDSNLLYNSFNEKEEKKDESNEIINYFPENKVNKSMNNKINISQCLSPRYMDLDNQNISNLENTFSKKLNINCLDLEDPKKETIKIKFHIVEPYSTSFILDVSINSQISKIKEIICKELANKNISYFSLDVNSFFLMKNYKCIQDYEIVKDTTLSEGDDVYIVLKESMNKSSNKE